MPSIKETTKQPRILIEEYKNRRDNGELSRSHEHDYMSKILTLINLQREYLENSSQAIAETAKNLLNSPRAQRK